MAKLRVPCLQDALSDFARAKLPLELARTRLELARALAETLARCGRFRS